MIVRSGCPVRRLSSTAMVAFEEGTQDLGSSMIMRSGCPVRSDSTAMVAWFLSMLMPMLFAAEQTYSRAPALARRVSGAGVAMGRARTVGEASML